MIRFIGVVEDGGSNLKKKKKISNESKIKTRRALTEGARIEEQGIIDKVERKGTTTTTKVEVVVRVENK